jgi:hypothetical protein
MFAATLFATCEASDMNHPRLGSRRSLLARAQQKALMDVRLRTLRNEYRESIEKSRWTGILPWRNGPEPSTVDLQRLPSC